MTGQPLAGQSVLITGTYAYQGVTHPVQLTASTNSSGVWSQTLMTSFIKTRFTWHAGYLGEPGVANQTATTQIVYVRPKLTTASTAHWRGSHYVVSHGHAFTLKGTARPVMAGKRLTVQYRSVGGKWHSTTIHALIRQDGRYAVKFHFQTTGTKALRFAYTGSTRGPWLSATAPGRLFFAT